MRLTLSVTVPDATTAGARHSLHRGAEHLDIAEKQNIRIEIDALSARLAAR